MGAFEAVVRLTTTRTHSYNAGQHMQYDSKFVSEDTFPTVEITITSEDKNAFKIGKEYTVYIGSKV